MLHHSSYSDDTNTDNNEEEKHSQNFAQTPDTLTAYITYLKSEKDLIAKSCSELATINKEAKEYIENDSSEILFELAGKIKPIFESICHLSELIGGIKRLTEDKIPWDFLNYVPVAFSDSDLIIKNKNFVNAFIELELPNIEQAFAVLFDNINLLIDIKTIEKNSRFISFKINQCINEETIISQSCGSAISYYTNNILDESYVKNLENKLLGLSNSIVEFTKNYFINFNQQNLLIPKSVISYLISKKNNTQESTSFLGDKKNNGIIEKLNEKLGFYHSESENNKKIEIIRLIKLEIDTLILRHSNEKEKLDDLMHGKGLLTENPLKYKLGNIKLANLEKIIQLAYDKIILPIAIQNLKFGSELKNDHIVTRICFLEIITRNGEMYKKLSMTKNTAQSWIAARSRIYHAFDSEKGIDAFNALLAHPPLCNNLMNNMLSEYKNLTEYKLNNFIGDYIIQNPAQYNCITLDSSLQVILPEPPPYNIKPEELLAIQPPIEKKLQIIDDFLLEIKGVSGKISEEKDDGTQLSHAFNVLFKFKAASQIIMSIEDLIKNNSIQYLKLKNVYNEHHAVFLELRAKRGFLAHSPTIEDAISEAKLCVKLATSSLEPLLTAIKAACNINDQHTLRSGSQ